MIRFLSFLILIVPFFSASPSAALAKSDVNNQTDLPQKKNIILIVTDDLGLDLGCYGNKIIKTPNLDRLASQATRFKNAFSTTASCSASRSVILSGLHNHATAQYGHQHSYHHFRSYDHLKTLPLLLSKAGYRTARVGKYHVGPESVYPFANKIKGSSRHPVQMANNCKAFIETNQEKPFFLYFCTSDPHRGGGIAKNLPHQPDRFGNKVKGQPRPGITQVQYDPKKVVVPSFLPDTPTCRAELAQYYQSVSRIDQGVGRLIELLKAANQYQNSLIIFTSDHGIAFPGAKTTLYEPGMRVPMIVRLPDHQKKNHLCNAKISLVDLTPTILDFAGAIDNKNYSTGHAYQNNKRNNQGKKSRSKKYKFHGRSFLSIVEQSDPTGWDEIFASHTFHEIQMYYPMRVVHSGRYKLIWNIAHQLPFPFASDLWAAPTWQDRYRKGLDTMYGKRTVRAYIHRAKFELYDLEADPDETKNLSNDKKHAKLLAKMITKLKAFQKRSNDPWILKWQYE